MEIEIGKGKKGRRAYGFDDIAIVPSRRTRDPDDIDISWTLGPYRFELPMLAAAMDGVVSPRDRRHRSASWAGSPCSTSRASGPATRTPTPSSSGSRSCRAIKATREMQEIYREPVKPELVAQRVEEIKQEGVVAAGSMTPQRVRDYHELALEAGLDVLVIQGTVISAEHVSSSVEPLNLKEFIAEVPVPVHRGWLRQLFDRPSPDADRRGRRARRRRSRRRLHDPRRDRNRRPAGNRDRRRAGRPLAAHARDRPVRAT